VGVSIQSLHSTDDCNAISAMTRFDGQIMLATTAWLDLANMIRDTCWQFVSTWRVNSVELHGFNVGKLVL
jgi:hypothetical protein